MNETTTQAFEGINVADFSWVGVGPYTTDYLARHGAEVIKIESVSTPDWLRVTPPFRDDRPGLDRSAFFSSANSGKLSLSLNLSHPGSTDVARRLIKWADIVGESFTPGTMERWGLGYEDIKRIKPDIVMFSSCMQGQTGPHARHPGYGIPLTALSGFTNLTGWPDRDPVGPFGPYTDFVAPRFCAVALIAALTYRRKTGKGQYIDMSQLEQGMQFLAPVMMDYAANGRVWQRNGNRDSCGALHGAYRCQGEDRWCTIAVFTDKEWEGFCRVIGNPPWTREERFSTHQCRLENTDELDRKVEEWTISHSPEQVVEWMQAAGVAAGLIETGEDMRNDPQLSHYDHHQVLDHPEMGTYTETQTAFRLSGTPGRVKRSPLLGEHSSYVCTEILGFSDAEFAQMVADGIIE